MAVLSSADRADMTHDGAVRLGGRFDLGADDVNLVLAGALFVAKEPPLAVRWVPFRDLPREPRGPLDPIEARLTLHAADSSTMGESSWPS
jgi:hypothetical protein